MPPMVLQNNVVVGRFEGTPTMLVGGRVVSGAGEPSRVVVTATDLVVVVAKEDVGPDND